MSNNNGNFIPQNSFNPVKPIVSKKIEIAQQIYDSYQKDLEQ